MIQHSEALEIVLSSSFRTEIEEVSITNCIGRILIKDVTSEMNMPPFNKCMVDGYACLEFDLSNVLIVDNIVGAGDGEIYEVTKGHCIKVMTGAPLPNGANFVVMVEDITELDGNRIQINDVKSSSNISPIGEDIRTGDKILEKGTLLKPFHCGILATLGYDMVPVSKKVNVGIIVTGDEIIEPGNALKDGQIYNSNAYQLINNCRSINIEPEYAGIVNDTYEEIEDAITNMIARKDVVIVTGGVSMGDYDYVAPVLENSGLNVRFDSIAAQPGRPLVYAENGEKFVFGMPGNPVSGLVLFETIVKPFLYKMMLHDFKPCLFPFKLKTKMSRKKSKRKSYYPVELNADNTVSAINYHGSAHLNAYSKAFGIIAMEQGVLELEEGTMVDVRQI
jgi:molybdopterin molybdotransferase